MLTARDFCTRRTALAGANESLRTVARRMCEEHADCVIVVADRETPRSQPLGILTERDIVSRSLALGADWRTLSVEELMSCELVTVRADDSLSTVLQSMQSHGIHRVPVVDQAGLLAGMVRFEDVLEFLKEHVREVGPLLAREAQRAVQE